MFLFFFIRKWSKGRRCFAYAMFKGRKDVCTRLAPNSYLSLGGIYRGV